MNKLLTIGFLLVLFACQDKKNEFVDKVAIVACQDTKDMIINHANDVVPLVGKALVDYAVPESVKKGLICDCLTPSVKQYLSENFQANELEAMLIDKPARNKAIKKSLANKNSEILKCYKEKGFKGAKLIEGFFKAIKL